jgi:hypothetical protein
MVENGAEVVRDLVHKDGREWRDGLHHAEVPYIAAFPLVDLRSENIGFFSRRPGSGKLFKRVQVLLCPNELRVDSLEAR